MNGNGTALAFGLNKCEVNPAGAPTCRAKEIDGMFIVLQSAAMLGEIRSRYRWRQMLRGVRPEFQHAVTTGRAPGCVWRTARRLATIPSSYDHINTGRCQRVNGRAKSINGTTVGAVSVHAQLEILGAPALAALRCNHFSALDV